MTKRLLVVAGGTGGHIFPGIAVAQFLQTQAWQVSWVGTADRMEADVVPRYGFEIDFIAMKGVRGNGVKRLLSAPFMVLKAVLAAKRILQQRKPDVVLAMGGYVTGPVGVAAKLLGIPLVIHEQNAVAGMSNKLLAKIASRVLAGFPGAFSEKLAQVVGNPVRASVADISDKPISVPLNLLIVGGSLGAKALNETVPEGLKLLQQQVASIALTIRHQSGKHNQDDTQQRYESAGINAEVSEFIHDMDAAYAWADLVICRAGALTVSEIAAAGKAAVFVPFPHAVDDHQTANAQFLVSAGAAYILQQSALTAETLAATLKPLVIEPQKIATMAAKARQCGKSEATSKVAQICTELSN
ncbi:undecaprenyldiphospho-muramoylpentapeptide beta-N-acetylglucosaminyltransferase [Pseudoalteromonas piscicida]|uniref:UDP-N-acetylglucosamine--N-acetylmuramyl-(pentapeptide) pyrophosphoryl-undecaprenol N-acetylglucosamine transferase n=1 Tax=Pseudoalteromonas piscicida TaxID=43662 RepID=A0AAD0RF63_PSEO7|nr:undecaprenyldiphospho-muramoylpentapeptide beta-N-acetylglucosaminyltransferase [Pseudoalteromonas piscicida]ASD68166.1 undecaprenyldiphospho-muramoylpentapeptide beta-N-acetylglucosaminyltransferase [Pseudoalteromonas piscicida]AXQ99109.1 undecaprenyldiphospho-muramoylpentapeptide beta-N-acetylglucosaminyltransferase [Pseudoalteromonas piscicida]AXR01126.1 undecaprenyldiphospho-muramoylpentapeptide beta-N-acetylglucosaminyltransferase [Pseudoalteromonas piscicida]